MLYPWQIFGFNIHAASNGGWTLLPRDTAAEGGVPGLKVGYGDGVSVKTFAGTERRRLVGPGYNSAPPHPGEAHTYWFSFPVVLTRLLCPVAGC